MECYVTVTVNVNVTVNANVLILILITVLVGRFLLVLRIFIHLFDDAIMIFKLFQQFNASFLLFFCHCYVGSIEHV